jgi:NADH-quinone oxidoreductase subunit J
VTLATVGFWAVALALLASSLAVVLTPNLFHAVLFLAAALVLTAGVFLLLGAEFLAWVQLLLYAGGVVTIMVFAIMLTERLVGERITQTSRWIVNGAIVAAAVFAGSAAFVLQAPHRDAGVPLADPTTGMIRSLLGPFALSFELLAVLLVAALVGAIYLARADE